MSDDGSCGLTLIAFIGSVFSPYYARARRRGPCDASDYCALNVVLFGKGARRWTMTERRREAVQRSADTLAIGPSQVVWDGSSVTFDIDELTCPLPMRVRGHVKFHPIAITGRSYALDRAGLHRWSPIAPQGRVEVSLDHPQVRWKGSAYLDANAGQQPLESAFASWHWSRAPLREGSAVLYDVHRRGAEDLSLALRFDRSGRIEDFPPPPRVSLESSRWQITRMTRADHTTARVEQTVLDAPFYARSTVSSSLLGQRTLAVHESLSLDRFRSPWVQAMLPFRIPRPPA